MRSINKIFEDVVKRVAEKYGSNVSFLFGDWAYISSQLTEWGKSSSTCKFKFPIICLYSPFTEDRNAPKRTVSLEFIIMVNTRNIPMKTVKEHRLNRYFDLSMISSLRR